MACTITATDRGVLPDGTLYNPGDQIPRVGYVPATGRGVLPDGTIYNPGDCIPQTQEELDAGPVNVDYSSPTQDQMLAEQEAGFGPTQAEMLAAQEAGFSDPSFSQTSEGVKETEEFMAKLVSTVDSSRNVIFYVMPVITESRSATYDPVQPIHHPGTIQVYKTTQARSFNVTAKFVSRTIEEATRNLDYKNLIASWLMPYYGSGTADLSNPEHNRLGAPPDILKFSAYGAKNIKDIPVVLISYDWSYSTDSDFIPTADGTPFPTIFDITLVLHESYSPTEFSKFNISDFRAGNMAGAYGR